MKKSIPIIALLVCFYVVACNKIPANETSAAPKCEPELLSQQHKSIFVDDLMPQATTEGPVAVFKFTQSINSYANTSCKSKPNECKTLLEVQNITDYHIRISYTIHYSMGNNSWSADGFADIAPDSSFQAGQISTNCGWISSGLLQVVKKSVVYKN